MKTKKRISKKALAMFLSLLMLISSIPLVAIPVFAENQQIPLKDFSTIYSPYEDSRGNTEGMQIVSDGYSRNTSAGVMQFDISNVSADVKTAKLVVGVKAAAAGKAFFQADIYATEKDISKFLNATDKRTTTDYNNIFKNIAEGTTGAATSAKSYFGVSKPIASITAKNLTGSYVNFTFDISSAVRKAKANNKSVLNLVIFCPQSYYNNGNSIGWSDIWFSSNAKLNCSTDRQSYNSAPNTNSVATASTMHGKFQYDVDYTEEKYFNQVYKNVLWMPDVVNDNDPAAKLSDHYFVSNDNGYRADQIVQYGQNVLLYDGKNDATFGIISALHGTTKPTSWNWNNLSLHACGFKANDNNYDGYANYQGLTFNSELWRGPDGRTNFQYIWFGKSGSGVARTKNSQDKWASGSQNLYIGNIIEFKASNSMSETYRKILPRFFITGGWDKKKGVNDLTSSKPIYVINYKKVLDKIADAKSTINALGNVKKYTADSVNNFYNAVSALCTFNPDRNNFPYGSNIDKGALLCANAIDRVCAEYDTAKANLEEEIYKITYVHANSTTAVKDHKYNETVTLVNDEPNLVMVKNETQHTTYSWNASATVTVTDDMTVTEIASAAIHTYGNALQISGNATNHKKVCSFCGYEKTEAHNYRFTNNGLNGHLFTCMDCAYTKTENHTWNDGEPKNPQCEQSYTLYTCTYPGCGETKKENFSAEFNHDFTVKEGTVVTYDNNGNDTSNGTHTIKCNNCDVTESFDHVDNDNNHVCDYCGHELAASHVRKTVSGKEATCLEAGYSESVECEICHKVLTPATTLPKKTHTFTGDYTVNGNGHSRKCIYGCGYYGIGSGEGSIGRIESHVSTGSNVATCTTAATCDKCNATYGDPLGHDFTGTVVKNNNGTHSYQCNNGCGEVGTGTGENAVLKADGGFVNCTLENGEIDETTHIKTYTCSECGYQGTVQMYSVSYTVDGEAYGDTNWYEPSAEVTVVADPTQSGRTFSGWSAEGVAVADGKFTMPESNVTFTGSWTANTYTVTFDANGGELSGDASKTVKYNEVYGELPEPTRTGHTFAGWYTEATGGTKVTAETTVEITADQTLYAHWAVNKYTVTYNCTGEDPIIKEYAYGTTVTVEATPSKDGYTFSGWQTSDVTVRDGEFTMPAGDVTFSSYFTPDVYTITYHTNGGSVIGNGTYDVEQEVTLPTDTTKDGYTFAGWYNNAELTGEAVTEIPQGTIGDKTYYAKWNPISYKITYNLDNGENNAANPATYTIEDNTITLAAPTKTGYTFKGWFSDENFATPVTEIKNGSTGDVTLYAKWEIETYSITYDLDGGENNVANPAGYNVTSETITLEEPTKTGYTFGGWYSDENFATQVTEIAKGSTGDVTLYAKWEIKTYSISYDLDGGENNEANPKEYDVTSATITLAAPTKTGYTFKGWFSDENFATQVTEIENGSTGDVTLYAKWEIETYNISYVLNDGTNADNPTGYTIESEDITLKEPTKTGYTFGGWYSDENFATQVTEIKKGSTGDVTLYAKWTIKSYTVTFVNDNGNVLQTSEFNYGSRPEYEGTPTKTADETNHYTFSGWSPEFAAVTDNVTYTAQFTGDAHEWGEGTVTTTPTCTNAGEKTFTCTCGKTKTEPIGIDPNNHVDKDGNSTLVKHDAVPHNCTTDGNIEYWECTACHKLYSDANAENKIQLEDTVDPKAHDFVSGTYVHVEGTETHAKQCKNCDAVDTATEPCTIANKTNCEQVISCPDCGYVYEAAAEHVFEGGGISAIAGDDTHHNVKCTKCDATTKVECTFDKETNVIAPTCTEQGYTTHTCRCGNTKTDTFVNPTGHDFTGEAVDQGNGTHSYKCINNCGSYGVGTTVDATEQHIATGDNVATCTKAATCDKCKVAFGNAINHANKEPHARVEATCTAPGNIEYWYCPDCDANYSDEACTEAVTDITIPAINHKDKKHFEAKAATCQETGNIEYWYCDDCKTNYSNEACTVAVTDVTIAIDPDNHAKVVTDKGYEATCVLKGRTDGSHCEACGKEIVAQVEINVDPNNHKGETRIEGAYEPGCFKAGYTGDTICCDCDTLIETGTSISPTGKHDIVLHMEASEPDCTHEGRTEIYKCTVCGEMFGGELIPIDPQNHIDTNGDDQCDRCGKYLFTGTCTCICHKTNPFMKFMYKILRAFWKFFKIGKSCRCGDIHY